MNIDFVNKSKIRLPRKFISRYLAKLFVELRRAKVRNSHFLNCSFKNELVIVFLSKKQMRKINFQYRNKKYATDILSFEGSIGELVICPEVIKNQAIVHGLTFNQELTYMLIHGVLHLLGYDHEKNFKEEKLMFEIQDSIFEKLTV